MKLDSLLKTFKEIDNNLKNDMITDRIKLYNNNFKYDKFVDAIKKYIDNFSTIREIGEDELLSLINDKANKILSYTKSQHFDVHAFTNDAIFLMEKAPNSTNYKEREIGQYRGKYLENIFHQILLDNGYPEDKVIKELAINSITKNRIILDIVILNQDDNRIAYVEIRSTQSRIKLQEGINQIKNRQLHNMIFFIAIFIHDEEKFVYFRVNGETVVLLDDFPAYNDLTNGIELNKKSTVVKWDEFVSKVDFEKLKQVQKNIKDENYDEGEKVRAFLKSFALSLQEKIPKLKSYKWKLNQASTQPQWTDDNGFRLSFYKGGSLPSSTQMNITFWASWHGGVFIKDNENLIFSKHDLVESLQKQYPSIKFVKAKKHIMAIHFKNSMPKEDEVIDAIKQLLDILETIQISNNTPIEDKKSIYDGKSIAIPSKISIKKKSEMKSVLGVEVVANTLASIMVKGFDDVGMMIGIFGKWGRGKTHFSEKLWESIKEKKKDYKRVLFSAWKYQDTKASWAYLYENIFNVYLNDVEGENTWIRKIRNIWDNKTWHIIFDKANTLYIEKKKIFRINIQKHTWAPIIMYSILLFVAMIWTFFIDKVEIVRYIIGLFGILLIIKFFLFYFAQKSSAIDLYDKYFFKNNFGNYLGLQSEIENELIILLKTWIPSPSDNKKIVLFVDDIDRCNIEQVINIVDGLRVVLDNPEIHSRLIIVTAIDETILRQALVHKYEDTKIDSMYREYLEKIFIIGLKLNTLNDNEIEEIICTILPDISEEIMNNNKSNMDEDITDISNIVDDNIIHESTNSEKIAIDESVTTIIETQNDNDEVVEINIHEKTYLLKTIKKLDNVTPRKIRIFYYKYLMMKILFDIRIKEKGLMSDWNKEKNEKIIIDLLIHLANDKESDDFDFDGNSEILKELIYVAKMVSVL